MIRAYITTWQLVPTGHYQEFITPIQEEIRSSQLVGYKCALYWGDPDTPTTKSNSRVLVLVDHPTDADSFAALPGVYMLPPFDFNFDMSLIPQGAKNGISNALQNNGFPSDIVTNAATYGDVIDSIALNISAKHTGPKQLGINRSGEFS